MTKNHRFGMYQNTIYDEGQIINPFECMKLLNYFYDENIDLVKMNEELGDENKELKKENKRYKYINKELEDRLDNKLVLDMGVCGMTKTKRFEIRSIYFAKLQVCIYDNLKNEELKLSIYELVGLLNDVSQREYDLQKLRDDICQKLDEMIE